MGFIQAVLALGKMETAGQQGSALGDIQNYLQLPLPLTGQADRAPYLIRVWLKVKDKEAECLDVEGVSKIDMVEYASLGDETTIRQKCLYKEPKGANVQWQFSPIYKLGKAVTNGRNELLGTNWDTDNEARYFKLRQRVLTDYERVGFFSSGSVQRILRGLEEQVDTIVQFWSDRRRSYLLVFGLDSNDAFRYPGEVPQFISYFRKKLGTQEVTHNDKMFKCYLCGESSGKKETLDQVFKFSTFDKPGFLPGIKKTQQAIEKVAPICRQCLSMLLAGREIMENRFVNFNLINGVELYVIPEIISDHRGFLKAVSTHTQDFLEKGIRNEQALFESLVRQGEGLVYHFLFAERNQAQIVIHFLVEDVPPSHLRILQNKWKASCLNFNPLLAEDGNKISLDTAFRQTIAVFLSLSGKSDQDKRATREKALEIIASLLNEDLLPVSNVKNTMVSKFSGLFNDPDWMFPQDRSKLTGQQKIKGMAEVVDFFIRVNGGDE